ncbi:hypothetical protein CAEBREN_20883 [Caenorhabditis brenneri]|uniref:Uncharacterized protein n=1 Tax=Caenorhabditis brenneri TaxID=135651 RepID=G0MDJ1_CAEBE|nr:hypothetical protein CAEBREN_20883 [Caenorhabditis brenneri]
MGGLFQQNWLPIFTILLHLILLPLIVLCSGKKSDLNSVAPTQETGETASPSTVGNESESKMTPDAELEKLDKQPTNLTKRRRGERPVRAKLRKPKNHRECGEEGLLISCHSKKMKMQKKLKKNTNKVSSVELNEN